MLLNCLVIYRLIGDLREEVASPDLEMDSFSDHASDGFASSDSMDIDEFFEANFEAQSNDQQCKDVLDPYLYVSPRYFSFDRETYRLMEIDLQWKLVITIEMIKSHDARGLIDLKRWKRLKENLCVLGSTPTATQSGIRLKSAPHLRVPCIEDWESIIYANHTSQIQGVIRVSRLL